MHFTTLISGLALGTTGWAAYTLQDDYFAGGDFFGEFSFWDGADPTEGFVAYQNETNAQSQNLISSSNGNIKMMADSTTSSSDGRAAVRITSNKSYQSGLIVVDIDHMPGGICGTWPAFWTTGPDWPTQGEIDIVEGVNNGDTNQMTLHTGPSCSISQSNSQSKAKAFSGTVAQTNCDVASSDDNTGCGITTADTQTYGSGFNSNKGGVFATEWTTSGISVYFFPRSSIPSDIEGGTPDPSSWGTPQARFEGGCDFGTSFTNQQIVFTNTFCGSWAGESSVWGESCAASTGVDTCEEYVQNNPKAFEEAFWSVNALKVYQNNGDSSAPSSAAPAPSASAPAQSSAVSQSWPNASVPVTSYAPGPTASASQSGWAPIVSDSAIASAPAAAPTTSAAAAPSSPAETQSSQSWQQQPSQTWGGGSPWQSGSPWGQSQESDDGSWSVGTPAMKRRHARHLAQHKRHVGHAQHAAGRLS